MRMQRARSIIVGLALVLGFAGGLATVSAQDATPESGTGAGHPAHVHAGTCESLGDVVYPLNDVTGEMLEGTPSATPASVEDAGHGEVVAMSQTDIDATMDDLLGEEYAINVHESADNMGNFIACANIEGEPDENGALTLDLQELNESGVAGQAVVTSLDDGNVSVRITLTDAEGQEDATPEA